MAPHPSKTESGDFNALEARFLRCLALTDGGTPQNFAYAVIPTCTSLQGMTEQDGVTSAVSHEWIEAATDPFPSTGMGIDSAYAQVDYDHPRGLWQLSRQGAFSQHQVNNGDGVVVTFSASARSIAGPYWMVIRSVLEQSDYNDWPVIVWVQ